MIDNMKYRQKKYCKVLDGNHKNFRELQMQNNYFVQSLFRVVYNKIPDTGQPKIPSMIH